MRNKIRRFIIKRLVPEWEYEEGDYFYLVVQDLHGEAVHQSDKAWEL